MNLVAHLHFERLVLQVLRLVELLGRAYIYQVLLVKLRLFDETTERTVPFVDSDNFLWQFNAIP